MASGDWRGGNDPGGAEKAYAEYLRRLSEGARVDFESFCARHEKIENELRSIHEWVQLGRTLATSRSLQRTMRDRFGDVEEVTVELATDTSIPSGPGSSAAAATGSRYDERTEVARGGMGVIDYHSLVREARALRPARESGYRVRAWERLGEALALEAPVRNRDELRREAIACMGDFVGLEPEQPATCRRLLRRRARRLGHRRHQRPAP